MPEACLFSSYKKRALEPGSSESGQASPLRAAPMDTCKPDVVCSQLQFLSSPLMGQAALPVPLTGRKLLPFQTEEPPLASSFVRSQIVGNSSAAYSRTCLRTARSREERSEQDSTAGNLAGWPQDATA